MPYPKVTIIWLNYNSMPIIEGVLASLEGVKNLDYPNYELIVVDNGSTDGSYEKVKSFIEKELRSRAKILRMNTNLGFTGGVNAAFQARDPESKYVILLNNDAVPEPDSVTRLVEEMEARPYLGAAQGVILDPKTGLVDTAGVYLSEYLFGAPYLRGEPPTEMKKPLYITYADGAYSIWRVEAVLKANNANRMFYDELFAYCDDNVLGLKLWHAEYRVASFPFIAARHSRGSTFGRVKSYRVYLSARCWSFLYHATNITIKAKLVVRLLYTRKLFTVPLAVKNLGLFKQLLKAWRDGKRIAERVVEEEGRIDITRAPLIKLKPIDIAKLFVAARLLKVDRRVVEERFSLEET